MSITHPIQSQKANSDIELNSKHEPLVFVPSFDWWLVMQHDLSLVEIFPGPGLSWPAFIGVPRHKTTMPVPHLPWYVTILKWILTKFKHYQNRMFNPNSAGLLNVAWVRGGLIQPALGNSHKSTKINTFFTKLLHNSNHNYPSIHLPCKKSKKIGFGPWTRII